MSKPYFVKVIENIAWDTVIEPGSYNINKICAKLKRVCPGDYEIEINPDISKMDLCVNGKSFGIYLVFSDIYSRLEWLLKYS